MVETLADATLRVAAEDSTLIAGADIAVGDKLEIFRIVLADQDAAFVAGADKSNLHRITAETGIAVAEICGCRERQNASRGDETLHKSASRHATFRRRGRELADDAVEVLLADGFLFGS